MEDDLIGEYVGVLRRRLAWRSDVDDIVDEIDDHLREHSDHLLARGVDARAAHQETLSRFGDLALVTASFAEASTGALALPTRTTRMAGFAGLAAGLLWLAAAASACLGGLADGFHPWTLNRYLVWAPCTVAAILTTTTTLLGGFARVGRLRTRSAIAALLVMGLTVLVLTPMTWAVVPVMVPGGLAALIALRGHLGESERILRPLRLLGVWAPAVGLLLLLAHVVPIGPVDEYGDRPYASLAAFMLAAIVSAIATTTVGLSLAKEHPVDPSGLHLGTSAIG